MKIYKLSTHEKIINTNDLSDFTKKVFTYIKLSFMFCFNLQ